MGVNDSGVPGRNLPASEDHVMRRIADLERVQRELGPSIAASIKPAMDDIRAQQATLTTTVADIAANVASINDLLTRVVVPASVNISSGVTFTAGSYYDGVQTNITVPAGVSRLQIQAFSGILCFQNSNTTGGTGGGGDYIYIRTVIGGVTGQGFLTVVLGSNSAGSVSSSLACTFTGLTPGSTISLATQTMSGYQNIPAHAGNKATLSALLTWLV